MLVNVPAAERTSRGRSTSRSGLTQSQHRKLRASRRRCSYSHRGPERLPDVNTSEITIASGSRANNRGPWFPRRYPGRQRCSPRSRSTPGLASRPFSPRPSSSTAPGWSPIVRRLRSAGLSGATTQRGIWGFHGDHPPHGDRLLQLGRHVPVVTIVIDTPKRISAAFSVIDELTSERGLVTSEIIPAMRASADDRQRGGTRLATHHLPDIPDPDIPDSGRGDGRD